MELTGFTIGQVAARLHVSVTFLRRLDEHGIVAPTRSRGGHRRYTGPQLLQVRRALTLLDEGFPLATISRVLAAESELQRLRRELDQARAERDKALRALSAHRVVGGE